MLADCKASHVIVGHSERRQYHGEDDASVAAKLQAAHRAGLVAIACVGETKEEREAGNALSVVRSQVEALLDHSITGANSCFAYEPVWAIGTGLTPTVEDVAEMHTAIRETLAGAIGAEEAGRVRLLYGGSVKPGNAREFDGRCQCRWRPGGRGEPRRCRFPCHRAGLLKMLPANQLH